MVGEERNERPDLLNRRVSDSADERKREFVEIRGVVRFGDPNSA